MKPRLDPHALSATALRTGLTEGQVADAITQFRLVNEMTDEPEWGPPVARITMADCAVASWSAEGTRVTLQMFTPRRNDGQWGVGVKSYCFAEQEFETFAEARFVELAAQPPAIVGEQENDDG